MVIRYFHNIDIHIIRNIFQFLVLGFFNEILFVFWLMQKTKKIPLPDILRKGYG